MLIKIIETGDLAMFIWTDHAQKSMNAIDSNIQTMQKVRFYIISQLEPSVN